MRSLRRFAVGLLAVLAIGCGAPTTTDREPGSATTEASSAIPGERPTTSHAASRSPSSSPGLQGRAPAPVSRDDLPTRVVIDALDIDLPVVSGDLEVEGNPSDYPLCDVAQYLTTYRHPGRPGTTTWVYAHARRGMFLPLLDASRRGDGARLLGTAVDVFSSSSLRYRYRITGVHPHAVDRGIAAGVPADEGRLVLQTSEGPRGTVPKLQVSAVLVEIARADAGEAAPSAVPRECYD